jgi:hypothetical protein
LLKPGENAVVRVHPTFPKAWPVIEEGSKLKMLEGLRTVATALVLEVVPPSSRKETKRGTIAEGAAKRSWRAAEGAAGPRKP